MIIRILAAPFVLGILICLYMAWETDESYATYILPQAMILVAFYILQPQIEWWWYKKRPPQMEAPLARLLDRFVRFYHHLTLPQKLRFRNRVVLFMMANDFIPMGFDEVPDDLKCVVAANAVALTFGKEEFLFSKFERVVVYPMPFPSPQHPEHQHASELYEEDGVLLFSGQQLLPGTFHPAKNFNIGLYEYAKAYCLSYPNEAYPSLDESVWEQLEAISGQQRAFIEAYVGLPEVDLLAVSITLFFTHPAPFKKILPDLQHDLSQIFNLDPANIEFPIIDQSVLVEKA